MSRSLPSAASRPWEYSAFPVSVAQKQQLSPGYTRITLAGPALRNFAPWGLDQRIKLVLPMPDGSHPDFGLLQNPTPHPNQWHSRWKALPEERRNVLRTYTPSAIRAASEEIDVDMFNHHPSGPASTWALTCSPGDELVITGPDIRAGYTGYGIHYKPPREPRRLLLIGDAAALPAIRNIMARLPAGTPTDVFLELDNPADNVLNPPKEGTKLHVVEQGIHGGSRLAAAVREWGSHLGDTLTRDPCAYTWIAGETSATASIRRYLTHELAIPKESVAFLGYWKLA